MTVATYVFWFVLFLLHEIGIIQSGPWSFRRAVLLPTDLEPDSLTVLSGSRLQMSRVSLHTRHFMPMPMPMPPPFVRTDVLTLCQGA